jgi:hypothetical protein
VDQRQHFPNKSNQIGGEVGEEKNQAETMNPMGAVTGRRSMSTISKAVAEITGVGKTKTRKATSELCTFMGIPHHSRSEIATIISKFIKLHSARVLILPFFSSQHTNCLINVLTHKTCQFIIILTILIIFM